MYLCMTVNGLCVYVYVHVRWYAGTSTSVIQKPFKSNQLTALSRIVQMWLECENHGEIDNDLKILFGSHIGFQKHLNLHIREEVQTILLSHSQSRRDICKPECCSPSVQVLPSEPQSLPPDDVEPPLHYLMKHNASSNTKHKTKNTVQFLHICQIRSGPNLSEIREKDRLCSQHEMMNNHVTLSGTSQYRHVTLCKSLSDPKVCRC